MEDFILIFNIFFYFLSYKVISLSIKNIYYFPFRLRDLVNFFLNLSIFISLNFQFKLNYFFEIFTINCLLLYFIFHVINMIETSPRTKILIDLKSKKKSDLKNFKKSYSEIHIVQNRLKRFLSTNQIKIKNDLVLINNEKQISFLIIIEKIFKLIKQI